MSWKKVCDESPPLEVKVLARWDDGHIEDVTFSDDGEEEIYHFTYDGEVLDAEPIHWMPLPAPPAE